MVSPEGEEEKKYWVKVQEDREKAKQKKGNFSLVDVSFLLF